jgi:ATP-dependent DNA helicase RecG
MLDEPVGRLLGPKTAKALLNGLDIVTVQDLLRHYPRRYAERGQLTDLASLRVGEHVTVMAQVESVTTRRMRQRRGEVLEVVVTDGKGHLTLTFFGRAGWRAEALTVGRVGLFSGKVSVFRRTRQLTHPDYVLVDDGDGDPDTVLAFAGALIPVYPATAALPSWRVATCVGTALDALAPLDATGGVPDPLPPDLRARRHLVGLAEAFRLVHRPASRDDVTSAKERLTFEEAFVLQVELARRRVAAGALPAVPRRPVDGGVLATFDERLPFVLTEGQVQVGRAIAADMAREHPMHRLLQGEVGSGKTVVALRAMLTVVDSGGQAALLAPTEVLAQQHHRSLTTLLGPLAEAGMLGGSEVGTRVALLTGSLGSAARRRALLDAAGGQAGIVVGTHALVQDPVAFADLGLVVVDEQHRFGVEQRAALAAKGTTPPHVLVMTATPIPRTIAMTVFGDLEVSTLTELPVGREPITSFVVPTADKPHYLERAWGRIREEVAAGRQAYVVCPRIGGTDGDDLDGDDPDGAVDEGTGHDDSDDDGTGDDVTGDDVTGDDVTGDEGGARPTQAVLDMAARLAQGPLADLRLEVLHGRLPAEVKEDVMLRFAAGEIDVLVATTVIEVGVDVPNASVMVVMDADRFGVSQLHQLRGRVGRGGQPGLCLLVTDTPEGSSGRERVDAVASTTSGFVLSEVDLANRREGDVLGASQSGRRSSLRLLSVLRDEAVIVAARAEAAAVVEADPELSAHPDLLAAVTAAVGDEQGSFLEKA